MRAQTPCHTFPPRLQATCTKRAPPGVYFWKGIKESSSSVTTESLPHLEFFPKSVKKGNNHPGAGSPLWCMP